MKPSLSRLDLRHNWPLVMAIAVFGLSVGLIATRFSLSANLEAPKYGETISYWSRVADPVLYNLMQNFWFIWPIIILASLFIFAIQHLPDYSEGQGLGCVLILFANLFGCAILAMSFLQPDGDKLVHIQIASRSNHTYHLTLDNVQGGGADYFYSKYFVFACDSEGKLCHMVYATREYSDSGSKLAPVHLIVEPVSNMLYLQVGDQKTLIVQ